MIFSEADILQTPQLSDLRFVDVTSAPEDWNQNEKHHICFQEKDSQPTWMSEPVNGKLLDFKGLFRQAKPLKLEQLNDYLAEMTETLTLSFEERQAIQEFEYGIPDRLANSQEDPPRSNPLPPSLTIFASPTD